MDDAVTAAHTVGILRTEVQACKKVSKMMNDRIRFPKAPRLPYR